MMSMLKQTTTRPRDWLAPSLENALRLLILAGAVALMASAAHASVTETASQGSAPTLQLSIGFCALALASYRRQRAVAVETAESKAT